MNKNSSFLSLANFVTENTFTFLHVIWHNSLYFFSFSIEWYPAPEMYVNYTNIQTCRKRERCRGFYNTNPIKTCKFKILKPNSISIWNEQKSWLDGNSKQFTCMYCNHYCTDEQSERTAFDPEGNSRWRMTSKYCIVGKLRGILYVCQIEVSWELSKSTANKFHVTKYYWR